MMHGLWRKVSELLLHRALRVIPYSIWTSAGISGAWHAGKWNFALSEQLVHDHSWVNISYLHSEINGRNYIFNLFPHHREHRHPELGAVVGHEGDGGVAGIG